MKVILIGFMGSGKSTVAKHLAQILQLPIWEMDTMILEHSGASSIPQLFEDHGETHFRALERNVAEQLSHETQGIISTGGGIITEPQNLVLLRKHGAHVVYLHTRFETLQERLQHEIANRPLWANPEQTHALYNQRLPEYKAASDVQINTDTSTPTQVAAQIA
ncbi:MAG: shikimate kinase, partial [Myxococcota bacterium]